MNIKDLLVSNLGGSLAKFLLKTFLGEPAGAISDALIDVTKTKIEDTVTQRQAARDFEEIGDQVAQRLTPLFEDAHGRDLNVEAVVLELKQTLNGRIKADFFLTRDLDPLTLTEEFRRVRPLPKGMFSARETTFYDRALAETVRYMVGIAAELPKFEATLAAESLQRLSRIGSDLENVLDTVQRIERCIGNPDEDDAAERFEADYRQAVLRNLDFLELFGADIPPESKRHALSVAYVSLNLESDADDEDNSETYSAESVLDRLGRSRGRLLIRGEAGSGKSTLFRWIAREAAREIASPLDVRESRLFRVGGRIRAARRGSGDDGLVSRFYDETMRDKSTDAKFPHSWRDRIPFLIRLRECDKGRLPSPDEFPRLVANELGNPPEQWVTSILRERRAIVLFDVNRH